MSPNTITGRCQCGAVHYAATGDVLIAGHCHCHACKKSTGSGHASVLFVPKEGFEVKGETTKYTSTGDSGNPISRHFCPTCGSRLFGEPRRMNDVIGIMVGTLDDPEIFVPNFQIYTKERASWDHLNCDAPEFEGPPPPSNEQQPQA